MRVPLFLLALAVAGCDAVLPNDSAALDFADRIEGVWSLSITAMAVATDGQTSPLLGGPLTGGRIDIVEGINDEGTVFRTFAISLGNDWISRGFRPPTTRGFLRADDRAERIIFIGANSDLTDVAGTIEADETGRQAWAFYVSDASGATQRILWTLTR